MDILKLENQRRQNLLHILQEKRIATVAQLTELLHSSEATIRRDLVKLEREKKLIRVHGGAKAIETQPTSTGDVMVRHVPDKVKDPLQQIAKQAAALCQDGESIIINSGSTTQQMLPFLKSKNLNILTNSYIFAHELAQNSKNQVALPGGELYPKQGIVLSAYDNDSSQHYCADKMFMGTPGFSEFGVTESDALLIRSEQKLRRQAQKLIILADAAKLGKRSNFIFCQLSEVDTLITDAQADPELVKKYQQLGVQVIIADLTD